MKDGLARLEGRMEQLVEGTFARLFAGRLHTHEVAVKVARALEDHLVPGTDGSLTAADHFSIRLNPADAGELLEAEPQLSQLLAEHLLALAREAGLTLLRRPSLIIVTDREVPLRAVLVEAWHSEPPTDTTSLTPVELAAEPAAPPKAFLIVQGERHVPLTTPVISIGRRLDNHIILDHPKVSRCHAQLRLRGGRYVLYDLGSSGGTRVNEARIQEHVLQTGDVISLAGVLLIYGEEDPPRARAAESTRPFPASAPGGMNSAAGTGSRLPSGSRRAGQPD